MATRPTSIHPELIPTQAHPIRDPDLPHQIVLMRDGVSCNCRRIRVAVRVHWGERYYTRYIPFAPARDLDEAFAAYYDASNHVGLGDGS